MGPLAGIRIVEFAGLGPAPFAAMLLSDMGAKILRIDRKGGRAPHKTDVTLRGRRAVGMDLKRPEAAVAVLKLIELSDALIEGFRPCVMERLGLGPDVCFARNPRLVYGRMTGWGQAGPLAQAVGHDINYIALSGALHAIGSAGAKPVPPLNLVGDFGGGALYLAFGIVCGLLEARRSGRGQVVDAAMTDGAASLMSVFYGLKAMGFWSDERGINLLDSGAHFYDTYETKDGKYVAIGAIEARFHHVLVEKLGLAQSDFENRMDRARWPDLKQKLSAVFKQKTRDEWDSLLLGSDACYAPVLSLGEAPVHPHNRARNTFVEIDGVTQPAPAPRFSVTVPEIDSSPDSRRDIEVLADWGFTEGEIAELQASGIIAGTE